MMKKMISIFITLAIITAASAAAADTWATHGDGKTTVRFTVKSDGNASVEFTQSEGQCQELSYTHLIDGIMGTEEEWGKYHFYITGPDGSSTCVNWDKTFHGGSFSISLPKSGTYSVRVVPYTAQEMTDSWYADRFIEWTRQPRWQVSGYRNCSVSASSPSGGDSQTGSRTSGGSTSGTRPSGSQTGGRTSGGSTSGTRPSGGQTGSRTSGGSSRGGAYDMGIPNSGSQVYRYEEMNMTVFWVQVQLKATGSWYQGSQWDCTGRLGDHTMSEISAFMRSRGYRSHSGQVDQDVIDELVSYLGGRVEPVYVGGIYDYMDSIMWGGSAGGMDVIWSNLIDMVPHVTAGARWVQTCLKRLGYYNSAVDGMYGEGTERAVKAFQRDYGWEQRNYVTLGVARAMLEAYAAHGGSLNALP